MIMIHGHEKVSENQIIAGVWDTIIEGVGRVAGARLSRPWKGGSEVLSGRC
jgi:hypothetical protein